jgi:hypothetical protein
MALFALLPAVASIALLGSATAANADTSPGCVSGTGECFIMEDMGSGFCEGNIIPSGNFAYGHFTDYQTGYTCEFWVERNVNNSGWYRISDTYYLSPGADVTTPNYWNGPGYQARVCMKFIWSSTSSGATHCSPGI